MSAGTSAGTAPGSQMTAAGMRPQEYDRLREVLHDLQPVHTLEIGMAQGGSTRVICDVLRGLGRGKHTAIDPFQSARDGWAGKGIACVREAGLESYCEVIEDFDYLAMPRLAAERRSFDFILIDGWHSFDYTLLDVFYADLLLREQGVLAIHDTGWPAVCKACRFLETHKPYDRLSPPVSVHLEGLAPRLARRLGQILGGPRAYQEAKSRRTEWYSLSAYRKRQHHQVPDNFFAPF